jgi:hypothetical protein
MTVLLIPVMADLLLDSWRERRWRDSHLLLTNEKDLVDVRRHHPTDPPLQKTTPHKKPYVRRAHDPTEKYFWNVEQVCETAPTTTYGIQVC